MQLIQGSEQRHYYFQGDSERQTAVVVFEHLDDGFGWRFSNCNFRTNRDTYTELDWEFLGAINEQIEKIHKSLIKSMIK